MKALVASPGAEGDVDLVEVDEPEPGADQIVVDVKAASLNRADLAVASDRSIASFTSGNRPQSAEQSRKVVDRKFHILQPSLRGGP